MDKTVPNIVYLTQCPAPYRERMHEVVASNENFRYSVIYCTELEPNRNWKLDYGKYSMHFLSKRSKSFRHNNYNVIKVLRDINPNVIIITGFSPTMLYAFFWTVLKHRKIIVYNDGTYESEKNFSILHKLIRKIVFKRTSAFVAPGNATIRLYKSYNIKDKLMFKSCLCVENGLFKNQDLNNRDFHIMFSGQIIGRKMPLFFTEIAKGLKKYLPALKVLIVGEGTLRETMLKELDDSGIEYLFTGFLDQKTLLSYYSKSKLFLFPSLNDPWGIVANEACASGTPVITCTNAGAANDLVVHNKNGYVLPLDVEQWIEYSLKVLTNAKLLEEFSKNAIAMVKEYNPLQAAKGIQDSIYFSLSN